MRLPEGNLNIKVYSNLDMRAGVARPGGGDPPSPIIAGWSVRNCRRDGKNWPVVQRSLPRGVYAEILWGGPNPLQEKFLQY